MIRVYQYPTKTHNLDKVRGLACGCHTAEDNSAMLCVPIIDSDNVTDYEVLYDGYVFLQSLKNLTKPSMGI